MRDSTIFMENRFRGTLSLSEKLSKPVQWCHGLCSFGSDVYKLHVNFVHGCCGSAGLLLVQREQNLIIIYRGNSGHITTDFHIVLLSELSYTTLYMQFLDKQQEDIDQDLDYRALVAVIALSLSPHTETDIK
ncbi:hypothetical protein VNO77_06478 [Canavalia gladiata]|uniref:Uncharacterized protein n=1 Tax=Canavalia gladiata TaxID=3824 RepID=A0AAN9M878_CANGL